MSDTDSSQPAEKKRKPDGTTLTVEEWIELMDKHDSLTQYAKKCREEADDE